MLQLTLTGCPEAFTVMIHGKLLYGIQDDTLMSNCSAAEKVMCILVYNEQK